VPLHTWAATVPVSPSPGSESEPRRPAAPTAGRRCAGPARRRAASTRSTRRSAGSGRSPNLASPRNHASPRCRERAVATRSGSPSSAARWPNSARPWPGCAAPCDRRPHPATTAAAAGHRVWAPGLGIAGPTAAAPPSQRAASSRWLLAARPPPGAAGPGGRSHSLGRAGAG